MPAARRSQAHRARLDAQNIGRLTPEQALTSLHTRLTGLDEAEAARRHAEYGDNTVEQVTGKPVWQHLLEQFGHFFALILWLAAGLALLAHVMQGDPAMATLGFAIISVIVINGLFSFWQEYKAEQALAALRELLPLEVKVRRDGQVHQMPASRLVPGDIVLLTGGDAVPADCRVLSAFGLRVNNAILTGESVAQSHHAEADRTADAQSGRNCLFAGTSVVAGEATAAVYATGMRTRFGHVAHLTQATEDTTSPLTRELARLSRWVAAFATLLGIVFLTIGLAIGLPWNDNMLFAIGIIVANVPEGLLPTVTLSLAMATQRMAKRKALVRHLPAVETLSAATVIVSDKTGTLTENRMRVLNVYTQGREYAPDAPELPPVMRDIAGQCHSLLAGAAGWIGDPMEIALMEFAGPHAGQRRPRRAELPFDSERKRMAVLQEQPEGLRLFVKGAAESVLPLCRTALMAEGEEPLDSAARQQLLAEVERMAERGLRVLALAYRLPGAQPLDETDMVLAGLVGIEDPPRPEVAAAIATCRQAGIRVILCTGDHAVTASAIARQIGLWQDAGTVVTGDELERLSDTQLQLRLDHPDLIFARTTPEQKQRIVTVLQRKGEIVAVTGDGVNDAPALKSADIGIAMGLRGSDVAKAAADIVLLDDNFATIVDAIEEGRAVYANIRKFLSYILTSNIPELVPYLAFVLLRIPLPLTIVQILAVDLGTDMLPALALGAEPPDSGVMREPPRPRHERLLTMGLLLRAYGFLGLFEAAAALFAFFSVMQAAGWHYGTSVPADAPLYLTATTACLTAIVLGQVVNVFLCRHSTASAFRLPLYNRWLAGGLAFELGLILLIVYTPPGQYLFGTAPLSAGDWLVSLPILLTMLLAEELRKAWMRRHHARERQAWPVRRQIGSMRRPE
ncbi:cation-transporting P-type ATPase [Pseudogulbenkiania sp. MAI-1]|uniref:cation-translocating P-type ATPase n=1 Tax=Pseudogulbenkiania sp. MAI-1 TaxID=990370 RepID=UPI00045EAE7D|nr:cation-transporting P-type ATPase [Pseudogulbenkiania sp. MAI-1]